MSTTCVDDSVQNLTEIKAINERIAELGIEDCKVRVTNVDSQESGKSIVLQVVGEMSVKGLPHRKFVQTFVLAEQPNGYFVLNDIFRYIADEPEDEEELEPTTEEAPAEAPAEAVEELKTLTSSGSASEQARDAEIVSKKLEQAVPTEVPTVEATSVEDPIITEAGPIDEPEKANEVSETAATESVEVATLEPEKPKDPEPTPNATPAPVAAQAPPPKEAPAPAPAPAKPAAPKTWASMLAGGRAPPAVPVVPKVAAQPTAPAAQPKNAPAATTATTGAAAVAANQAPTSESDVPASPGGWQTAGQDHGKKQNRPQPASTFPGYIKNVTANIDAAALKTHLTQYGKLAYFDVSRPKNCAFIEFESQAGYNAAVAANPHKVSGEEILVEERRPRPNNFNNNFRGGARGGRGNMDGRTPSQGGRGGPAGGRGGFAPRGRGGPANRGRGGAQEA